MSTFRERYTMSPGLVSIVTPSFNSAIYLPEALESVIGQSYPDWEMLIIDDKSTDGSVDIAERYAARDSRIRVIPLKDHGGAAVARNVGIEQAKGRYIGFLDSDDIFDRDKLRQQVEFMSRNQFPLTHAYYGIITESGEISGQVVTPPPQLRYREMLKSNQIGCLTAIYDAKALGKVFMPLIQKRQDYGLWLRILRSGVTAYCLPRVLAYYRVRSNSISRSKIEMLGYNWRLLTEIEGLSPLASSYYLGWHVARALNKSSRKIISVCRKS